MGNKVFLYGKQILAWLIKQPQPTFAVSKPDSSNYDPSN